MKDLIRQDGDHSLWTELRGAAAAMTRMLQSPASGVPCVHWRLRVTETVAPGMQFVHDLRSEEPFSVLWLTAPEQPPRRLRVPDTATIQAVPVLHREGSPGALAVARALGLVGSVRVEEILVRADEPVMARGFLIDDGPTGPFRAAAGTGELAEAEIQTLSRRPVRLLPWALGTSAFVLGTLTTAAMLVRKLETAARFERAVFQSVGAQEIGSAKLKFRRWP
jgi:hypothetical protein